jgi:hypothetical protein
MHLPAILGAWGAPPDRAAWGALVVGVGVTVAAVAALARGGPPPSLPPNRGEEPARFGFSSPRFGGRPGGGLFVAVAAFVAALLSLGYVAFYLRGGSRIIDATAYFLQARAIHEGHFAWHVPEPSASFRGRFLVSHDGEIAGIFPPGYPLLLSLGFAVGAPFFVGVALAALLVVATWGLARELAREAGMGAEAQESAARVAAALSVVCAALRYHTADTMAHGACALAFTLAILAALRARRERLPWFFLLAGGALGFVVATRFASAMALGAVLAWLAYGGEKRKTALFACALGAIPGVLLLLAAESAATGHALGSAQTAYYAASDGPPGCFRYGFGKGIGCLVEHGEFVRARASDGYGIVSALGVTLRRLRMHLEDVANLEPLALLVLVPFLKRPAELSPLGARAAPSSRGVGLRACGALVLAQIAAYAPFYFDGDYPGGGARFFADVLPVEHALVAVGLALVARRGLSLAVIALSCFGFAVHASYDHAQLRDRDGGHPMFDHELLASRSIGMAPKDGTPPPVSLVFVDTDHGFDLGHDPGATDRIAQAIALGKRPSGLVVARLRSDDHDRLLYERLGRPATWVYKFLPDSPRTIAQAATLHHEAPSGDLEPWSAPAAWVGGTEAWRFEAESEWPPLAQTGSAWAEPIWATDSCASPSGSGRALALHASGAGGGAVTIALPVAHGGPWRAIPRLLSDPGAAGPTIALLARDGAVLAQWSSAELTLTPSPAGGTARTCLDAPARTFTVIDGHELRLVLTPGPDDATHLVALDRVLLSPSPR